jgi:hypothetical protein
MRHVTTMILVASFAASPASPAWSQGVSLSPDGNELIMEAEADKQCFRFWLRRTINDRSRRARETTLDCAPPVLDPKDKPNPARVTVGWTPPLADCIEKLIFTGQIPPWDVRRIRTMCKGRLTVRR